MCRGCEQMLNEIAFLFFRRALASLHANDAFAAAPLGAKCTDGSSLDESAMRDADDATLIGNEIFHVDLSLVWNNLRQARRAIFVADVAQFLFDDGENS